MAIDWEKYIREEWGKHDKDVLKALGLLEDEYDQRLSELDQMLAYYYTKYADKNGAIDYSKMLTTASKTEKAMSGDALIKYSKYIPGIAALNYLTKSKEEVLETKLKIPLVELGYYELTLLGKLRDGAYKTGYDYVTKKLGNIPYGIDLSDIARVLNDRWNMKGWGNELFSERVWKDKDIIARWMSTSLREGLQAGRKYQDMIRELHDIANVSRSAAKRLVVTEANYVLNQGNLQAYKDMGIEEYKLSVIMDSKTSDICETIASEDKTYKVLEAEVGVNYPPFHPHCRTTSYPKVSL